MNEESLNLQIRKFLKKAGINSQREIEAALRKADVGGDLRTGQQIPLSMTLTVDSLDIALTIEDTLTIE